MIYNHQILSIFLILIGFLANCILTFLKNDLPIQYLYLLFGFLGNYILTTVILFWEKGLMEKNRLSPYKLLFFEGISGTIINLFALIPCCLFFCSLWAASASMSSFDCRFTASLQRTWMSQTRCRLWCTGDMWNFLSRARISQIN